MKIIIKTMKNSSRIYKDIKYLDNSPMSNATAVPLEEDISLWHGNVSFPLTISG